jgi:catechol 2,3-dioxygenase-like lactoylglutathione lyase family enzyme
MEHVGVVVDDLAAATEFFVALGLEVKGEASLEHEVVDRIVGLEGVKTDVVMLEAPDGGSQLELCAFHAPKGTAGDPRAAANVPGLRHVLFSVDDIEDSVARLQEHGAELVGEVARYEDSYLLCYLRGPAGIIVELAEKLGGHPN